MGIKPMTREEAIIRIKDHMRHHGIGIYPHIKLAEALNMAISELSSISSGVSLMMKHLREMDDQRSVGDWLECCICCGTCIHNSLHGYEKPCSDCQESGELASWTAKYPYCPKCGRPMTNEAYALLEKRLRGCSNEP